MISGPAAFWLWQAVASVACAALVVALAMLLHRVLAISHASRAFWLGAWALAMLPTPVALLISHLAPASVTAALPLLAPWAEIAGAELAFSPHVADSNGPTLPSAWLAMIWIGGVALGLLRWAIGIGAVQRLLRNSVPITLDDPPGEATRRECMRLRALGIEVRITDATISPFAWCWPRPVIVLPRALSTRLPDRSLRLVLRHEAAHLQRHDPHWAVLLHLGGLLLWFNPLLRVLARRVHLAAELACDAQALAAEKNMRRAYAEAYLETLRMSMTRALACPAIAFSPQDPGDHSMRIRHIVHGDPQARKRPLLSLALATLALATGASLVTVQASNGEASPTPIVFSGPIIEGRISSPYGKVRPAISARAHNGIDLAAARGTPINAPAAGTVMVATASYDIQPRYGTVVMLDHGGGWQTMYAHLDSLDVEAGDRVASGQRIGRLGSTGQATGPHVHVEVLHDGERVDPATVIANPVSSN